MSEMQTPVAEPVQAPAAPKSQKSHEQKQKNKRNVKNIITLLVIAAIVIAVGFAVWYFVFREDEGANKGEPLFDEAMINSIIQTADVSGTANAKDSASITLTQSGVVEELYVSEGQMVYEGDPLFVISSEAAEEALRTARESYQAQLESMQKLQEEMADLRKSRSDLTITAPHAGKLTEVADIKVGDPLQSGEVIGRVVDDTKLKLSLYYSYAYENDIFVGQTVTVSVPATMASLTGKVEKINKVRMVTPEGGINFEVVFVVDNPGTLTEDMAASVGMTDGSGNPIYAYQDGTLQYYQTTTVATKARGPVERLADLMNYVDVTAGQVLVVQGTNDVDEQIRSKQEQIDAAQKTLDEAAKRVEDEEKNLQNFSAVAPITGMVTALPIYVGAEVTSGSTAVMISNNSIMTVNIQVDDRNRQYINVGDEIPLQDWNGNSYMGVVDSIAVIGENQNGITIYPGVVRVDNPMGTLMGGYWLNGTVNTASSIDCITIPSADVRYYSPEGSEEPQAVVVIKTDEDREGAIDISELPEEMQKEIPKGCIVMPVEIGLNDTYNVEILSGVQAGDQIWNSTPKTDGDGYSSWG